MDFNTGGTGGQNPNDPSRPSSGGEQTGPPPNRPVGGPGGGGIGGGGGEFTLSDPVGSFVRTIRALISSPVGFFRAMPRRGALINPIAFAVICAVITAIPATVLVLLISVIAGVSGDAASTVGGIIFSIFLLILIPVGTLIGLFILAGIFHLLVVLLARSTNAGFGATLRVVAYSTFPNILTFLTVIPILGLLVSLALSAYIVVLNIFGIREAHTTTTRTAILVVLIPIGVLIILGIVVGVVFAIIAASLGDPTVQQY